MAIVTTASVVSSDYEAAKHLLLKRVIPVRTSGVAIMGPHSSYYLSDAEEA